MGLVELVCDVLVSCDTLSWGSTSPSCTGQKLHVVRETSQYKSISSLRKPDARRFETHLAVDATSYRERGKHAAVNETPGTVTKLIGILEDTSRCDYITTLARYKFEHDKAIVGAPIAWCSRGRWAQLPRRDRRAKTT